MARRGRLVRRPTVVRSALPAASDASDDTSNRTVVGDARRGHNGRGGAALLRQPWGWEARILCDGEFMVEYLLPLRGAAVRWADDRRALIEGGFEI